MKRIKKLFVLLLLVIPFGVNADMGAPEIKPYDMVVTNPDGVDYYDSINLSTVSGHLDKDTVITIDYENDNSYSFSYNDTHGYLKDVDNLVLVKDTFDPEKETLPESYKLAKKEKAIVYADEGIDIQAGPAKIYKKVGHLKKGTVVEYKYIATSTYIYVETNNGKGWIRILDGKVLIENNTKYIFAEDYKTTCGTIPKNTIITPEYKTDKWSKSALFKYNKCETLINIFRSSEILGFYSSKYNALDALNVRETTDPDSKVLTVIPAGEDYIALATSTNWENEVDRQYVSYNGVKGWVLASGDNYKFVEQIDTIPEDEILETTDEDSNVATVDNANDVTNDEVLDIAKEPITNESSSKLSAKTIVIICVVAGVSLALAAIVTIILINKKKNKNNTENKIEE